MQDEQELDMHAEENKQTKANAIGGVATEPNKSNITVITKATEGCHAAEKQSRRPRVEELILA